MCKEKGKDEKIKAEISENSPSIRKRKGKGQKNNGVHKNYSLAIWEGKKMKREARERKNWNCRKNSSLQSIDGKKRDIKYNGKIILISHLND